MVDLGFFDRLAPAEFLALALGLPSCRLLGEMCRLFVAKVYEAPIIETSRPTHGGMGGLGSGRRCFSVSWLHCCSSFVVDEVEGLKGYKRCKV